MTDRDSGVLLPERETGSRFFHRILTEAAARYASQLSSAHLPSGKAFKKSYGDALVRFEVARIASQNRVEIARHLADATLASLRLRENGHDAPLLAALAEPTQAPTLETRTLGKTPGLVAEVPCDGRIHRGRDVLQLLDRLREQHHLTSAAHSALVWIVEHIDRAGGTLDLRGQRFALLGAGAELSPARLLLSAGATVLWVDVNPPALDATLGGTVVYCPAGDDLLLRPRQALAAIRRFADDEPVHLGLLAYAPGASRELRIACVMNAIAVTLGPDVVRSITMLISPTSPSELQAEDREISRARKHASPLWQRALGAARVLPEPGAFSQGARAVARSIVSIQGAGYQAAQYLAKIVIAEHFSAHGLGGKPITISANVAGITNTRSLAHPLFQVAFVGAPAFGVRIFEPETTRALSGLLMLHDLLNPDAPGSATRRYDSPNDRARAVRSLQIHGGIYDLPWQFDQVVRVAAVIGAMQRPGLLLKR